MSAKESIPVFGLNQDDACDTPMRHVSREEARQMKREKQGWFICNGKAFRVAERIEVLAQLDTARRLSAQDVAASTITISELRANAGLVDDRVRNPRETVHRARAKVRVYRHVLDSKNPTARGVWINPCAIAVSACV